MQKSLRMHHEENAIFNCTYKIGLTEYTGRENAAHAITSLRKASSNQNIYELAKYYYNTTYLVALKADHNLIISQILINHINTNIVMKLCQINL